MAKKLADPVFSVSASFLKAVPSIFELEFEPERAGTE
jgi:hypothetical protein